jgi:hypothetical protein
VEAVKGIKGTRYDWGAIFVEGLEALRITPFWTLEERPKDRLPTSLICSALADWAYAKAGLPNPGGDAHNRLTTPADWAEFILTKGWTCHEVRLLGGPQDRHRPRSGSPSPSSPRS